VTLTALVYLAGCPQFAEDSFEKVDAEDTLSSTDVGRTSTNGTLSNSSGLTLGSVASTGFGTTGSGGSAGGDGGTENGGSGNIGNIAGAPGIGGDGGSTSSTTGTVVPEKAPTTLVYATDDNSIYAAAWDGSSLGAPLKWGSAEYPIAFVEARMAPDESRALTGFQGNGDGSCNLYLYRHFGVTLAPAEILDIGEPENCLSARAFDIAFEQDSGRGLLVYALPGGELAYHVIEGDTLSEPQVVKAAPLDAAINWVRAVPESASNRIAVGFTAAVNARTALFVVEWDGAEFGEPHELVRNGSILDAESFDLAYYKGELIALRGDDTEDGFGYRLRESNGMWTPEVLRDNALKGNAQGIELRTMPYGVAGSLFDATGAVASFGTLLWRDGSFVEETRLDDSLPDVSYFEAPSLKTDIQRLGEAAVTVYVNDYDGEPDAMSSLGWAVLEIDQPWAVQHEALPIPFDQESNETLTRSMRLARFTDEKEGLLLAFADEDGLYVSALTDIQAGFTPPVLVEANVDGLATTPFALVGP